MMFRAIVLKPGDEDAINASLGYPRPGLRTDHTIALGAGVTMKYREPERDTLSRSVLVVDGVEAILPVETRARVTIVALTTDVHEAEVTPEIDT